ncbi:MAG TPA: ABC transporter substrate-binding protein, partial [Thalassobaculum sp.]
MRRLLPILAISLMAAPVPAAATEPPVAVSVLVPVTGFLALEGTAQRNGAVLALESPPPGVTVTYQVTDTATSPEVAVTALQRALDRERPVAVAAPIFGTQMLAMAPLAARAEVPLVTVSGTASITEQGYAVVFRFFPTDAVVKVAQARFAVEEVGSRRPALLYQTTADGQ